jgi:ArsR family transcriptional regulator, lead/cadmium/zinc/bismuth-responsive transcriptional repressor
MNMKSQVPTHPPTHACEHDSLRHIARPEYAPGELESAAAMCKALSDPSRLRLLLWLAQGEMCVSELVEREQDKLSSVSARLKLLYNARLVTRRRETKHVFYALADQHVHDLLDNVLHHAAESSAGDQGQSNRRFSTHRSTP